MSDEYLRADTVYLVPGGRVSRRGLQLPWDGAMVDGCYRLPTVLGWLMAEGLGTGLPETYLVWWTECWRCGRSVCVPPHTRLDMGDKEDFPEEVRREASARLLCTLRNRCSVAADARYDMWCCPGCGAPQGDSHLRRDVREGLVCGDVLIEDEDDRTPLWWLNLRARHGSVRSRRRRPVRAADADEF